MAKLSSVIQSVSVAVIAYFVVQAIKKGGPLDNARRSAGFGTAEEALEDVASRPNSELVPAGSGTPYSRPDEDVVFTQEPDPDPTDEYTGPISYSLTEEDLQSLSPYERGLIRRGRSVQDVARINKRRNDALESLGRLKYGPVVGGFMVARDRFRQLIGGKD